MTQPSNPDLSFLEGGGSVGAMMRAHDWSTSPLGEPAAWPQSLRTIVGLVTNSRFPMFVAWGPQLAFLYNDAYAEILEHKHPSAIGRPFPEVWSEIWADVQPIAQRALNGQSDYYANLPLTMRRKGYAEETWFTFSYSPARDEQGNIAGVYCACTETTDQVLSERRQAAEYMRFRELFQQAPGLVAIVREPNHVFEFANDSYIRLVGRRELIGKPVAQALPEVATQGFVELLDHVYRTGAPYIGNGQAVSLRRTAGSPLEERFVDFIFQPIRGSDGKVLGVFIEGSDVTERVVANQALRESELRLRQLANTIPHLAWIAQPDGQVAWYNDRWYEYTGRTPEEMQGWGWQAVQHPERVESVTQKWKASIATGTPFEDTFPLRGKDGEYRPFFTRVAPLRNSAGEIVQWFGTNTDVAVIEEARRELELSSRRKDEFLAMLAHELRNPMAPISTAAEILKRAHVNEEMVRRTSAVIARQVAHMTEIVDDLLDVSRVTRGLVTIGDELVDLLSVVDESIEQTQSAIRQKNLHFSAQLADGPLLVRGDRTRLVQVFSNILHNAAKYTPADGHIWLGLGRKEEQFEFAVRDDGVGISPELLPHLFELFTQAETTAHRSQGGLGLGLSLVKSLVALHKGSVSARSDGVGRGSEFVVLLPAAALAQAEPRANDSAAPVDAAQRGTPVHLMVVDDNEDAALTLVTLLEAMGHVASVAFTGKEALDLARERAPHLLFLDIGLPDMDGYELARRLRLLPETSASTIVALTGYGQPDDVAKALQAGFDRHLVKPVSVEALAGVIREHTVRTPGKD